MTDDELLTIHDRIADVTCIVAGFKYGIDANPNGNQKQREALLKLSDFILVTLQGPKELLRKEMNKPLTKKGLL